MRFRSFRLLLKAVVILGALVPSIVLAQAYPDRPITLIVPFPPGGVSDGTARVVAPALAEALGQPVIIENRGGSGGNIGLAAAARANPDGYTLTMTPNAPLTMNPFMFRNYPFDPETGLAPIAMIGGGALGLIVPSSSPIMSVKDLIALAKAKPGELTFGHVGIGSSHWMAGILLNKKADIQIVPVPFQGAGPAMNALLGGHISMSYGTLSGAIPFVQSGKFRLIAVVEKKRLKSFPDVPTVAETVPGVETATWVGFFAPAGTPKPIIARLHQAAEKALGSDDVRDKLARVGVDETVSSPEELRRIMHAELKFWRDAFAAAGIEPQ
jgi:tripartite-type tricarboxylate transporter receptor subunit TctC